MLTNVISEKSPLNITLKGFFVCINFLHKRGEKTFQKLLSRIGPVYKHTLPSESVSLALSRLASSEHVMVESICLLTESKSSWGRDIFMFVFVSQAPLVSFTGRLE